MGVEGVYFCSLGDTFTENFDFDVAESSMKGDGHFSCQKQTYSVFAPRVEEP